MTRPRFLPPSRWLLGVGLALAIIAFALWNRVPGPSSEDQRFGPGGRPAARVAVEVAPVAVDTIRDIRRFTGTLRAAAQYEVAPRIGGRLEALLVDIGDRVQRGQVIARLDDAEFRQQVEQAEAEVEVAEAELIEARSSLEAQQRVLARVEELRRQQIASEAELESAEAEITARKARVNLAEAQVKQRRAALEAARVRLDYATIRADWQGGSEARFVGERFVDEGTTISANTPIVSVLDISELTGVINVTEDDYARISVGQPVQVIADAHSGREFVGRVARIAPLFRETTRQARIEVQVPNPQGLLKPGMFVRARVLLEAIRDATVIPTAALIDRDEQSGVFLVDREASRARFQPVTVGVIEGDRAQVLEPASLTGEVVTLGQHLLSDGASILVADSLGGEDELGGATQPGG